MRPLGHVNRVVELHGRTIRAESTSAESLNLEFTDVAVEVTTTERIVKP